MKKIQITIILLCICILSFSQSSYEILFNSSEHDEVGLQILNDQSSDEQILSMYYDCSYYDTTTPCTIRQFIYRLNVYGDTVRWDFNDVRGDTTILITKILKDNNGDYLWCGYGWDDHICNNRKAYDYFAKWNSDYELLWENTHQRPSEFDPYMGTYCTNVLSLLNGNYLVGMTIITVTNLLNIEYYLIEVDFTEGAIIKDKILNIRGDCHLMSLTHNFDSSEIMLHSSSIWMPDCQRNSVGIVYLDTINYDTIGTYCYNRDDDDPEKYWCVHEPYNAKIVDNNTLIVSGTGDCTDLYGATFPDYLFVYKYDSAMNLVKQKFLTNQDTLIDAAWYKSLAINENNEIIVVGNHHREVGPYCGVYDYIYIAKLNLNLDILSERYLGGDAYYTTYSMATTNDGGVAITGTRFDYLVNNHERDAFVIKTNGDLWVNQTENSQIPVHSAIIYPNPGNIDFTIRTTEFPSVLKIYNSTGNILTEIKLNQLITQISTTKYEAGLYTWALLKNNKIIDSGKWVKSNK